MNRLKQEKIFDENDAKYPLFLCSLPKAEHPTINRVPQSQVNHNQEHYVLANIDQISKYPDLNPLATFADNIDVNIWIDNNRIVDHNMFKDVGIHRNQKTSYDNSNTPCENGTYVLSIDKNPQFKLYRNEDKDETISKHEVDLALEKYKTLQIHGDQGRRLAKCIMPCVKNKSDWWDYTGELEKKGWYFGYKYQAVHPSGYILENGLLYFDIERAAKLHKKLTKTVKTRKIIKSCIDDFRSVICDLRWELIHAVTGSGYYGIDIFVTRSYEDCIVSSLKLIRLYRYCWKLIRDTKIDRGSGNKRFNDFMKKYPVLRKHPLWLTSYVKQSEITKKQIARLEKKEQTDDIIKEISELKDKLKDKNKSAKDMIDVKNGFNWIYRKFKTKLDK